VLETQRFLHRRFLVIAITQMLILLDQTPETRREIMALFPLYKQAIQAVVVHIVTRLASQVELLHLAVLQLILL